MPTRLRPQALVRLALVLVCGCQAPEAFDANDFEPAGATGQALSMSCAGAPVCSGDGTVYTATYRIGEYDTSRMDLIQVFDAPLDGTPETLSLLVRSLRAFSGPVTPHLRAEIYDPPNPALPDFSALSPLASGSVPLTAISRTLPTELTFTTVQAGLVAGHRYALRVYTDGVGAGGAGGVLVGVGAFAVSAPAWQDPALLTFLHPQRRTSISAQWGASRPRPAGPWDLAIGLTITGVDECALGQDDCGANAVCTNLPIGFSCACAPGWTGDGHTCSELDECLSGPNDCDPHATCTNTVGSYTCACEPGFTGDGFDCADVDECATVHGGCAVEATCTNLPGTFSCECPTGFAGDGLTCVDVDECASNNGACDPAATCTNTQGSRTCACPSGFTGDGLTCTDVNECDVNHGGCAAAATCTNTPGSHTCTCPAGYGGDGVTCTDVDECQGVSGCSPDATCTNTPGSRTCACVAGFTGDGLTCTDVNECATANGGCAAEATCTNTPGSRICACPTGYTGNGLTCTDVDECAANTDGCATNATCANTIGAFTCTCDAGYTGSGFTCVDLNECLTANGGCSPWANCTNTAGSRTCACNAGYTGDGFTCTAPTPAVSGTSPASGADGTIVTITGANLVPDATVAFRYGGTTLASHWQFRVDAGTLKVSAPLIPVGTTADVEVTQPGVATVVYPAAFTGAAPLTAVVSTAITIDATNVATYQQKTLDVTGTGQVVLTGPLELTGLIVRSGGRITHPVGNATGVTLWVGLHANILSGGAIDVTDKGYRGGRKDGNASQTGETWSGSGATLTGGATGYGGGSHASTANLTTGTTNGQYGDYLEPATLGSGGGAPTTSVKGGNGGGFVQLTARDVTVAGQILAVGGGGTNNAGASAGAGGGSGGSIRVRPLGGTFAGAGTISVAGGYDYNFGNYGGGGRVAITGYGAKTFSGTFAGEGTVYLLAAGGTNRELTLTRATVAVPGPVDYLNLTAKVSSNFSQAGDATIGTLLVDASAFDLTGTLAATAATFQTGATFTAPAMATFNTLAVLSSAAVTVPAGRTVSVSGALTYGDTALVTNAGTLFFGTFTRASGAFNAVLTNTGEAVQTNAGTLTIPTGLAISNGGNLHQQGLPANTLTALTIASNGGLTHPQGWEPGLTLTLMGALNVQSGGTIDVSKKGYRGGRMDGNPSQTGETWSASGPTLTGGATSYGGASHASTANLTVGTTNPQYGDYLDPTSLGSGGGSPSTSARGGNGGGRVNITATDVTVAGTILATGGGGTNNGGAAAGAGGGSGGTIRIRLNGGTFAGAGSMSVAGGYDNNYGHYAGGGRVAITGYSSRTYSGSFAGEGSVYLAAAGDANRDLTLTHASVAVPGPVNYLAVTLKTGASFTQAGNATIGTLLVDASAFALTGVLNATAATFQNGSSLAAPQASSFGALSVLSSSSLSLAAGRTLAVTGAFTYGTSTLFTNAGAFSMTGFTRASGATGATFSNTGEIVQTGTGALTIPTGLTLSQGGNLHQAGLGANTLTGLTIASTGVLTHPVGWEPGVVLTLTGALNVQAGGSIDVSDKGYRGGRKDGNASQTGETWSASGATLTGGATGYGGGSHASTANLTTGATNAQYGDYLDPTSLGSGGGAPSTSVRGGNGGGRVHVTAADVTIAGTVLANGGGGTNNAGASAGAGGGSGGTIRFKLTGGTFAGAGSLSVAGGYDYNFGNYGGGGRVAITGYGTRTYSGAFNGEGSVYLAGAGTTNRDLTLTRASVAVPGPVDYLAVTLRTGASFTQTGNATIGTLLVDASAFSLTGTLNATSATFQTGATFAAPQNSTFGSLAVLTSSSITIDPGRSLSVTGTFTYGTSTLVTNAGTCTIPGFTRGSGAAAATFTNTGELIQSGTGALTIPTGLTLSQGGNLHQQGLGANTLTGLTIATSGVLTHPVGWEPGVVLTLTGALNVQSGGSIDVTAKGYRGGRKDGNASTTGETWSPTGATTVGGATGYGCGSYASTANLTTGTTNPQYGNYLDPTNLGSGGGAPGTVKGGNGGGYVHITATDVTIAGTVLAVGGSGTNNGGATVGAGGGSGGTIRFKLTGGTFAGAGSMSVAGGYDYNFGNYGGGGRVAITGYATRTYSGAFNGEGSVYLAAAGATNRDLTLTHSPVSVPGATDYLAVTLRSGATFDQAGNATIGTLLVDASAFSLTGTLNATAATFQTGATFTAPQNSTFGSLAVLSSSALTVAAGRTLAVSGAFTYGTSTTITNAGTFSIGSFTRGSGATAATFTNTGELIQTGSGALTIPTGLTLSHGGNLHQQGLDPNTLAGLTIATSAVLTHPVGWEPGVALTINGSLNVQTGGSIDVTDKGYRGGRKDGNASQTGETWSASGATTTGGATGYGGGSHASTANVTTGTTNSQYGNYLDPTSLGSGGGAPSISVRGGNGGGRVDITAADVTIAGTVQAIGGGATNNAGASAGAGGGSGGTIRFRVAGGTFAGAGSMSVAGGYDYNFGNYGGGGRVAVTGYTTRTWSGSIAGEGSVYLAGAGATAQDLTLTHSAVSVPSATDYLNVTLKSGASFDQTGNATIATLLVDASAFALTGTLGATSATFQNGASFTAPQNSTFGSLAVLSSSSLAVAAGQALTVSGAFTYGTSTLVTNAGTFSIGSFTRGSGAAAATFNNTGELIQTGSGALTIPTGLTLSQGGNLHQQGLGANTLSGLTIATSAVLTHPVGWEAGLTLTVNGTLNVQTGGSIDVTAKGYRGGRMNGNVSTTGETWSASGATTVGGATGYGCGSYASTANLTTGTTNPQYGNHLDPSHLGSGGGAPGTVRGGNGGGYVNVTAIDVVLAGSILATGGSGTNNGGATVGAGGGSGGTIRLRLLGGTFSGAGGLNVAGGYDYNFGNYGGGGRVAITGYLTRTYSGTITGEGTVYMMGYDTGSGLEVVNGLLTVDHTNVTSLDSAAYTAQTVRNGGVLTIGGSPTVAAVTSSTGGQLVIGSGAALNVTGTLLFTGASPSLWVGPGGTLTSVTPTTSGATTARLDLDGTWVLPADTLTIPANLRVVHGGDLRGGATANTIGAVTIAGNGTLSHPQGYSPGVNLTVTGTLNVQANGAIDVSGLGLRGGLASGNASSNGEAPTGGSTGRSGGSYGGAGGASSGAANATYGDASTVIALGSGGATNTASVGGNGGGRVNVTAQALTLSGRIVANGLTASNAGGGSGGAIRLALTGGAFTVNSGATLTANGGTITGTGGHGGGGRLYVSGWGSRTIHASVVPAAAAGGAGAAAGSAVY